MTTHICKQGVCAVYIIHAMSYTKPVNMEGIEDVTLVSVTAAFT